MKLTAKMTVMCLSLGLGVLPMMAQEHTKSLDGKGLDQSISPKTDFYHHVNNKWQKDHPLTAEYSRYGQFNILNDSSNNRVKRIVTGLAATNPAPGTNAFKIATIYEQGMDSVRRNRDGATPIKSKLARIENTKPNEMNDLFRYMHRYESSPLFGVSMMEDLANSQIYSLYVG